MGNTTARRVIANVVRPSIIIKFTVVSVVATVVIVMFLILIISDVVCVVTAVNVNYLTIFTVVHVEAASLQKQEFLLKMANRKQWLIFKWVIEYKQVSNQFSQLLVGTTQFQDATQIHILISFIVIMLLL